jgi:hypothetical protein
MTLLSNLYLATNHGCVFPCVGPVIDIKIRFNLFYMKELMLTQIRPCCNFQNTYLPSVNDALLVIRRRCNFRDGSIVMNYIADQGMYLTQIALNDSYWFSFLGLVLIHYTSSQPISVINQLCRLISSICYHAKSILGFAAVFLLPASHSFRPTY